MRSRFATPSQDWHSSGMAGAAFLFLEKVCNLSLPISQETCMEETRPNETCPNCGETIPAEAPGGLCPKCLLEESARPTEPGTAGSGFVGFDPPDVDAIAAAFPRLEIVECIGSGGMGAVYRARQPHLDREVALKILPPSLAERSGFLDRFTREGQLLAKLSHPNIVAVHDFGESGGYCFLLMEFVDGVNLRQAMRAERFTPEQALEVVPKVCEALQFAHDEGILHRDIKPENILLDAKGRVKIADFGIAKLIGDAAEGPSLTRSAVPGTPQYMAPEQIEQPDRVDHRADIFSLGVVFYEMLTGELPMGRFPAPSERSRVSGEVDEIVLRSLEKDRDRRQQSAEEVRTQISEVPAESSRKTENVGDESAIPSPTSELPAALRPNWPLGYALLGTVLVLVALFISIVVNFAEENAWDLRRTVQGAVERDLKAMISQYEFEIRKAKEGDWTNQSGAKRRAEMLPELQASRDMVNRAAVFPRSDLVPSAFVLFWLLAGFLGVVAVGLTTSSAWRQLKAVRASNGRRGKIRLVTGALLFPWLGAATLIFSIILVPLAMVGASSSFVGVGISVGILLSLALAAVFIYLALRWLREPVSTEEKKRLFAEISLRSARRNSVRFAVVTTGVGVLLTVAGMFLLEPPHRGWLGPAFGMGSLFLLALMVHFEFSGGEFRKSRFVQGSIIGGLTLLMLVGMIPLLVHAEKTRRQEAWEANRGDWGIGVVTRPANLKELEVRGPEVAVRFHRQVPSMFRLTVGMESEDNCGLELIDPAPEGEITTLETGQRVHYTISPDERESPTFRFRLPEEVEKRLSSLELPEHIEGIGQKAFQPQGTKEPGYLPLPRLAVFPLFTYYDRETRTNYRAWVRVEYLPQDASL